MTDVRPVGHRAAADEMRIAVDREDVLRVAGLQDRVELVRGRVRERVPVYGSGGFTTYTADQMEAQLKGWLS